MTIIGCTTIFLFSCLLTGITGQDDCELTGYALTELSKPSWWKLPLVGNSGCVFAVTDGSFQNADCDFYFSICHGLRELPECNTNGDWSVCQKGTFNNQSASATIANYKPINESGTELTEGGEHGFMVFYTVAAAVTDLCQNVTVNLTFLCDLTATWPSTEAGGDVPNGVDKYSFSYNLDGNVCKYAITFNYNGACYRGPTIGPTLCYLSKYDFQFLADKTYWELAGDTVDICHSTGTCQIYFRVCQELPTEIRLNCGQSSGVCINRDGTYYNLGNYNNTFDDLSVRPDGNGFVALYEGGDGAFLGCSSGEKLTTKLNFICVYSSAWSNDSNTAQHLSKVIYDATKCTAEFYFEYSGACIETENTFDVPILFIFLVFIFILFALYWIIGSIVNVAFGKRGQDIIPNRVFWIELGQLFGGGFVFLFKLITCRSRSQEEMTGEEEPVVKKGYQTIDNAKFPFGP